MGHPSRALLEVIVTTLGDALAAEAAGADRLEVVADIGVGGLTPDAEVVASIAARCRIPSMVMVRPHARSFVYDRHDLQHVREAIAMVGGCGASGVVFGALTADGQVDEMQLARVGRWCDGLHLTFHRAFDAAADLDAAYDALERHADVVDQVLTSGGASTAVAGVDVLQRLSARGGKLPLLIGAGVDARTLPALHARLGARQYHVGRGARVDGRHSAAIDDDAVRRMIASLTTGSTSGS